MAHKTNSRSPVEMIYGFDNFIKDIDNENTQKKLNKNNLLLPLACPINLKTILLHFPKTLQNTGYTPHFCTRAMHKLMFHIKTKINFKCK